MLDTFAVGAHRLTEAQRRQNAVQVAMFREALTGMDFPATCRAILNDMQDRAAPFLGDWGGTSVDPAVLRDLAHHLDRLADDVEREQRRRAG